MIRRIFVLPLALIPLLIVLFLAQPSADATQAEQWLDKVDPLVLSAARSSGTTDFLVVLNEQADLSAAQQLTTKEAKGQFVYDTLRHHAIGSQGDVVQALEQTGADYRQFWINNMVWAHGSLDAIRATAELAEVAHIAANPRVSSNLPVQENTNSRAPEAGPVTWGISRTEAYRVWDALNITGTNVVIAGQDTGYVWTHTSLQPQYRGWNGVTATHDYNWHDSIHSINAGNSGTNPCGLESVAPCDDNGHGTHTMGTMIGGDQSGQSIGVAPGAEWIACRNMERGDGTPATYTECYEWFVAPWPYGGDPMADGDPLKAPHVINNSWSCPTSEGCSTSALLATVQAVRAAGIVNIVAAGNYGSSCGTVRTPAAIYDESFSVGASNSVDQIASFSSRGPVTIDGSNRLKPDVSAPGVSVYSSTSNGGYSGAWSGTSMAAPHIAGIVALMISARPELAGNVDRIEEILLDSAEPITVTATAGCNGDTVSSVPNHVFGHGVVNAYSATLAAQNTTLPTSVGLSTVGASSALPLPLMLIFMLLSLGTVTTVWLKRWSS